MRRAVGAPDRQRSPSPPARELQARGGQGRCGRSNHRSTACARRTAAGRCGMHAGPRARGRQAGPPAAGRAAGSTTTPARRSRSGLPRRARRAACSARTSPSARAATRSRARSSQSWMNSPPHRSVLLDCRFSTSAWASPAGTSAARLRHGVRGRLRGLDVAAGGRSSRSRRRARCLGAAAVAAALAAAALLAPAPGGLARGVLLVAELGGHGHALGHALGLLGDRGGARSYPPPVPPAMPGATVPSVAFSMPIASRRWNSPPGPSRRPAAARR